MKIRLGFVSNSSSSSFLVAFKDTGVPCPHCGRSDLNIIDLIKESTQENTYISENWQECLEPDEEEKDKETLKRSKALEEQEYKLFKVNIDYCDETLFHLLNTIKNVVIVERWS